MKECIFCGCCSIKGETKSFVKAIEFEGNVYGYEWCDDKELKLLVEKEIEKVDSFTCNGCGFMAQFKSVEDSSKLEHEYFLCYL